MNDAYVKQNLNKRFKNVHPSQVAKPLTYEQVRIIKGMRWRGDSYDDIASWLGISRRQVWKIVLSKKPEITNVERMQKELLPPKGPYRAVWEKLYDQLKVMGDLDARLSRIEESLSRLSGLNADLPNKQASEVNHVPETIGGGAQ